MSPHEFFFGHILAGLPYLHTFGEIAIAKKYKNIQENTRNCGLLAFYNGPADDHKQDFYSFWNHINWQNQVRSYEKHVPPSDHFSDGQKRIMLQNAVNDIMELRQVKNTADQMDTTSGYMFTYDAYTTLILSAASAYDDQIKATKSKCHVMLHEIQHDESGTDDDHYHGIDALFDIDCPVSSIQAYALNF
jgi:hypothetical protein